MATIRLGRTRSILERVTRSDVATVYRKATVSDGAGGQVDSYAVAATYSCSVSPSMVSGREVEQAAVIQSISLWTVHLPFDADVVPTDRIVVNGDRTFEVTEAQYRTVQVELAVQCQEIL